MPGRRQFLGMTLGAMMLVSAGQSLSAQPLMVEIIAMPHPPVRAALQSLREWLARQGSSVQVKEIDVESPEGKKRLQAAGLSGHIPVLILIHGQYQFSRKDGGRVAFVNFPNAPDTPPSARGNWTARDVEAIIAELMKQHSS